MSVYVDKASNSYGRMIMCHMFADTLEELHEMANKIGIQKKWFQNHPNHPHYDICKSKRQIALEHGAVELDTQDIITKLRSTVWMKTVYIETNDGKTISKNVYNNQIK